MITVTVRLEKDLDDRLSEIIKITKRTRSFYLRACLERYLNEMGDSYQNLDQKFLPK